MRLLSIRQRYSTPETPRSSSVDTVSNDVDRANSSFTLAAVCLKVACTRSRFRTSSLCNLCVLCVSVVKKCSKKQPQRHREHRGCTEKSQETDFSCKAPQSLKSKAEHSAKEWAMRDYS